MFKICKLETVRFDSVPERSTDKKGKSVSIGLQTEVISTIEKQVQSLTSKDKSVQVNLERCLSTDKANYNSDKLVKFLKYASDLTIKEIKESIAIDRNLKCIDLMSQDNEELVCDFYYSSTKSKTDKKISNEKSANDLNNYETSNQIESSKLKIEHLTFSCNLNQLIIGYSVKNHNHWCTHRSRIEFCNLYQTSDNRPNSLKTIFQMEIKNCITQLISHPTQFTKIAIGTISGTILIIDREQFKSNDDNCIKHESNIHKLEITFLSFKKSLESTTSVINDKNNFEFDELISCSLDGKIILWKIKQLEKQLQVIKVFNLSKQLIKQVQPAIRCAAFSIEDCILIVGSENNLFSSLISERSISNELDVDFEYEQHKGEIKSIEICPSNSNLFLTNGKDAEIRLYELKLRKPLYTIYLDKNFFNYKWINFRLFNEKFEKQTSSSNLIIGLYETNLYIINIYKKNTKYFTDNQSYSLKETFQKLFINRSNQLALVNSVDDVYLFDLNLLLMK